MVSLMGWRYPPWRLCVLKYHTTPIVSSTSAWASHSVTPNNYPYATPASSPCGVSQRMAIPSTSVWASCIVPQWLSIPSFTGIWVPRSVSQRPSILSCLSTFGDSLHYKNRAFVIYLVPHPLGLKLATLLLL